MDKSALEVFSETNVTPRISDFRPFGCPIYVLDNKLQAGQKIPKWHKRARLGMYVGQSPLHARSVTLVLNLVTGLVSPQFHVKSDDFFETVQEVLNTTVTYEWKRKCHLEVPTVGKTPTPMMTNEGESFLPQGDLMTPAETTTTSTVTGTERDNPPESA